MPASKSSKDDKVFDVARPGKTAANSTSKPVIIGHKTMLKDPMVKEEGVGIITGTENQNPDLVDPSDKPSGGPPIAPTEAEPATAPTVPKIKIQPVSDNENAAATTEPSVETPEKPAKKPIRLQIMPTEPEEPTPPPVPEKPVKVEEPKPKETPAKSPPKKTAVKTTAEPEETKVTVKKTEPKVPAKASEQVTEQSQDSTDAADQTTDEGVQDSTPSTDESSSTAEETKAVASAAVRQTENAQQTEKQAQEEAAKQKAIDQLVESKKYNAPIGEKTRKRSNQNAVLFLLLFLIVVAGAVYLLIDAEIISTNINLPYDLLK